MKPLDAAKRYVHIFYVSHDFDALYDLLAPDLAFSGPLFESETARDYIESLVASPPVDSRIEILQEFESRESACLIYRFHKRGKSTIMAQSFDMTGDRIHRIRLVFNVPDIC